MAWSDYVNAVPAEIGGDAGVRFNVATGRNYLAIYENVGGGTETAPTTSVVTGYISFEPHANRSNEGAFVRHDLDGNVTGYGNFDARSKSFRNFLLAVAAGVGGAALAGASITGSVTGAATSAGAAGGSGAFLGEGVVSGIGSWDAAYAAAASGASTTATTVGSTLKSALSSASTFLKPALSLASTLTGKGGVTDPQYVPFDQPATASQVNPLVWVALTVGAVYLLLDN